MSMRERAAPADEWMADRQALEDLVVDNPDLERLEALLGRFNLFEAVGVTRQELRHSDFLGFLLNPQQPHALGDLFLKKLLQRTLTAHRGERLPISLIDLDVWSLDDSIVLREWGCIDLLVVNEAHRLAVIIENKVGSNERAGQLARYRETVRQRYPNYRILELFLTPDGDEATADGYLAISYELVVNLIDDLLESRGSSFGRDLELLLRHYTELLRTHVVSNTELDDLCLRIYQKHQRALDLIFERRPDQQAAMQEVLEELIRTTPGLIADRSKKTFISFAPVEWEKALPRGEPGWSNAGRVLMFWFANGANQLRLILEIGPGAPVVRQRLFDMATRAGPPLRPSSRKLTSKYNRIYTRILLSSNAYEESDFETLAAQAREEWNQFLRHDYRKIVEIVAREMADGE